MIFDRKPHKRLRWTLDDGMHVWLRPIEPSDAPLLIDIFAHLSSESRYQRFNRPVDHITATQQQQIASQMIADSVQNGRGWLVFGTAEEDGVANAPLGGIRYVRLAERPDAAEMAVTVRDDMQRKGLGRRLMQYMLEQARRDGLSAIVGTARDDNSAIWKLIQRSGLPLKRRDEGSESSFELMLDGAAA